MLCFLYKLFAYGHPGSLGIKPSDVVCTHFDSFKPSRKVTQTVPFFWRRIFYVWRQFYNFGLPKGDFKKTLAWGTAIICTTMLFVKVILGL